MDLTLQTSQFSSFILKVVRALPAPVRTVDILGEFVANIAKESCTSREAQEELATVLCSAIEQEGLLYVPPEPPSVAPPSAVPPSAAPPIKSFRALFPAASNMPPASDAASQVREYLIAAGDREVTTRDIGRLVRPPAPATGGAPPTLIAWLRTLPWIEILGHSDAGGNIVRLRTTSRPEAEWYMLDAKKHIQGPYTYEELCARGATQIRRGTSGKFKPMNAN